MAEGKGYSETRAFAYLAKVSNEKPLQIKEIVSVAKKLKRRELFLDIGTGAGDTFFETARYFKKSIAIEPGERMFKILSERAKHLQRKNTGEIELIKTNWEDFYEKNKIKYRGKFDLIAGIHVAYFFKDMKQMVNEMLDFLSLEGRLIIICAYGENQEKDFVHYLRHKIAKTEFEPTPRFSKLKELFPENCLVDKKLENVFTINNLDLLENGRHLTPENEPTNYFLKFTLKKWFDQLTPKDKSIIKDFINEYKTSDGKRYIIPNMQRVYVFKK